MEWATQGERLQQLREAKGIKRHALAVTLGRTSQTVLNWEQGKHPPPIDMIRRLGEVLDATTELYELYGYTAEQTLTARVAELERRADEQAATIARLADLLGVLGVTLEKVSGAQAAKPRSRKKS